MFLLEKFYNFYIQDMFFLLLVILSLSFSSFYVLYVILLINLFNIVSVWPNQPASYRLQTRPILKNAANTEKLGQYDSYWPSFSVLAEVICIGRVHFFL